MFKQIVAAITTINTRKDFDMVCGIIEDSFQLAKITWKDRKVLFDLMGKIERNIEE